MERGQAGLKREQMEGRRLSLPPLHTATVVLLVTLPQSRIAREENLDKGLTIGVSVGDCFDCGN